MIRRLRTICPDNVPSWQARAISSTNKPVHHSNSVAIGYSSRRVGVRGKAVEASETIAPLEPTVTASGEDMQMCGSHPPWHLERRHHSFPPGGEFDIQYSAV